MNTMTKIMNENLERQLLAEKELLSCDDVIELIKNIEPIEPLYYYHRLICELFPDSEFVNIIGNDYLKKGKKVMSLRNALIRKAIRDNIHGNSIEISPDIYFNDIEDTLIRNDKSHGIGATGITRKKCFLIAFVFNLSFEQLENLMVHCLGDKEINYKDPYEVLIAYCTSEHTNVFEHYMSLKVMYEQRIKDNYNAKIDNTLATSYYKTEFSNVDTDEELINFVLTLPNTNSTSAVKVFTEVYDEIIDELKKASTEYAFDDISMEFEAKGFFLNDNDILKTEKYNNRLKNINLYDYNTLATNLLGSDFKKTTGTFKNLKKRTVFSKEELKEILENKTNVTKEYLLLLLFYKYYLCDAWIDFVEDYEEGIQINELLKRIYYDFCATANGYLEDAGFSGVYLPNALTRTLIFCLVTNDPIATFNTIMSLK